MGGATKPCKLTGLILPFTGTLTLNTVLLIEENIVIHNWIPGLLSSTNISLVVHQSWSDKSPNRGLISDF